MLTITEFKEIIRYIQEHEKFLDKLSNAYFIDIYRIPETSIVSNICDIFFKNIYGEDKLDMINYWLYEESHYLNSTEEEIEELYSQING